MRGHTVKEKREKGVSQRRAFSEESTKAAEWVMSKANAKSEGGGGKTRSHNYTHVETLASCLAAHRANHLAQCEHGLNREDKAGELYSGMLDKALTLMDWDGGSKYEVADSKDIRSTAGNLVKRFAETFQPLIRNGYLPAYAGCFVGDPPRFPSGTVRDDAVAKIHLAVYNFDEKAKWKTKVRDWNKKLAGSNPIIIVDGDADGNSPPPPVVIAKAQSKGREVKDDQKVEKLIPIGADLDQSWNDQMSGGCGGFGYNDSAAAGWGSVLPNLPVAPGLEAATPPKGQCVGPEGTDSSNGSKCAATKAKGKKRLTGIDLKPPDRYPVALELPEGYEHQLWKFWIYCGPLADDASPLKIIGSTVFEIPGAPPPKKSKGPDDNKSDGPAGAAPSRAEMRRAAAEANKKTYAAEDEPDHNSGKLAAVASVKGRMDASRRLKEWEAQMHCLEKRAELYEKLGKTFALVAVQEELMAFVEAGPPVAQIDSPSPKKKQRANAPKQTHASSSASSSKDANGTHADAHPHDSESDDDSDDG